MLSNLEIDDILKKYNTPLYLFDIKELKNRIKFLRDNLPDRIKLCYAIKANTFIVKDIEDDVDRFEVCSPGEYYICKESKINSSKILISGVYKTPEVISKMINDDKNIAIYSIESLEQFKLFTKLDKNINVMIRISSGNQFGINDYEAEDIIKNRDNYKNINIVGLQYFSGTQKKSIKTLSRELSYMDGLIEKLKEQYDFNVKEFEYGSGFPVQYFENEVFDEDSFLNEFSELINNLKFKGNIVLELGRSIAASCGTYITKVVDLKTNKGQNYAILDGGINHLVYYGQSMAMKLPKCEVYPKKESSDEKWNLCGSLCTINDILVKQFPTGELRIGDSIIFKNTGAYCMTEGISLFLSRDLPAVLKKYEDGNIDLIRDNTSTYRLNF